MREIKFRAFDKDRKDMEYINDLYWFEEQGVQDSSGEGHYANYILMQYIGLEDEDGKEIYEGDILNVDNGRYSGVVKFNEHDLSYVIENSDGGFGFVNGQIFDERPEYRTYRIIGNIYENPDLLTK